MRVEALELLKIEVVDEVYRAPSFVVVDAAGGVDEANRDGSPSGVVWRPVPFVDRVG